VLPFAPQYPLWSDGAAKRRWIRLPPGTSIDAARPDAWEFPAGTRLWKQFSVGGRAVETRFIERLADGSWRFASYVWNADGSDATLAPAAGAPGVADLGHDARHDVPGQADCRACHEGRATPVLGLSLLQLSPDRDPGAPHAEPPPAGAADVPALVARGLLRNLPRRFVDTPPRIDADSATARAALGYLHANCGGCHNPEGPLAPVALVLDERGDGGFAPAAALASTVARPSTFRPPGHAGDAFRVVPGRPDLSVLPYRMRSRDPLAQMPPLGTKLVDDAGLALVERWISEVKRTDAVGDRDANPDPR
jgi:hypothetical protein